MTPMLETERLVLTPPALADYDDSRAMLGDAGVMRFIGGQAATAEEAWVKLLRHIGHWQVYGYGIFSVRERAGGAYVGEVGLAHFRRGLGPSFDPWPEAAWVLAARADGRGYATEALQAAQDDMATRHGATRTVCIVHPDNHASLRVAGKLGYRRFAEARYRGGTPSMLAREPG